MKVDRCGVILIAVHMSLQVSRRASASCAVGSCTDFFSSPKYTMLHKANASIVCFFHRILLHAHFLRSPLFSIFPVCPSVRLYYSVLEAVFHAVFPVPASCSSFHVGESFHPIVVLFPSTVWGLSLGKRNLTDLELFMPLLKSLALPHHFLPFLLQFLILLSISLLCLNPPYSLTYSFGASDDSLHWWCNYHSG